MLQQGGGGDNIAIISTILLLLVLPVPYTSPSPNTKSIKRAKTSTFSGNSSSPHHTGRTGPSPPSSRGCGLGSASGPCPCGTAWPCCLPRCPPPAPYRPVATPPSPWSPPTALVLQHRERERLLDWRPGDDRKRRPENCAGWWYTHRNYCHNY